MSLNPFEYLPGGVWTLIWCLAIAFAFVMFSVWRRVQADLKSWKESEWACDCDVLGCQDCPGLDPGCTHEHARGDSWVL